MTANIQDINLSALPEEVLIHILNYLDPSDLTSVMCCGRLWRRLAQSDCIWENIARQIPANLGPSEPDSSYQKMRLYISNNKKSANSIIDKSEKLQGILGKQNKELTIEDLQYLENCVVRERVESIPEHERPPYARDLLEDALSLENTKKLQTFLRARNKIVPCRVISQKPEVIDKIGAPPDLRLEGHGSLKDTKQVEKQCDDWMNQNKGLFLEIREFYLWRNQITAISPGLSLLNNLVVLNLSMNQITTIPLELSLLNNLTALNLSMNQITTIPPELSLLNNLKALRLWLNQITAIPPELSLLNNLKELNLGENQITDIPPKLGALSSLDWLCLCSNPLTVIPSELGALSHLKKFYLPNNPFDEATKVLLDQMTQKEIEVIY